MFQPRRMVSGSADKCDRHALARPPAAAAAAIATCAVFDAASAPLTRIHTPRGRHRQTSETLFPRERNGPLGRRLRRRPDRRRQFVQVCRLAAAARKKRKYKDGVLLQKRAREHRWTRGERSSGSPREEIVYIATRASFQFSFFLVLIQRKQLRGATSRKETNIYPPTAVRREQEKSALTRLAFAPFERMLLMLAFALLTAEGCDLGSLASAVFVSLFGVAAQWLCAVSAWLRLDGYARSCRLGKGRNSCYRLHVR